MEEGIAIDFSLRQKVVLMERISRAFCWLVTIRRMPEEQTSPRSFEKSLEELERTVRELEKGDLPLERSLELFESGMRLSAECKKQLEEAETRVEVLTRRGSDMVALPFNPVANPAANPEKPK